MLVTISKQYHRMIVVIHSMVLLVLGDKMKIMMVGNDKRSSTVSRYLTDNCTDFQIYNYTEKIHPDTNAIILPTPVTSDKINLNFCDADDKTIETLIRSAPDNCLIIGAGFKHPNVYDLCNRDDFSILNAIPTAEGTIALLINNTHTTLYKSRILVSGFGRVSRILLHRLSSFGADVTVVIRKNSNHAEIKALGMKAIYYDELISCIDSFDIVINTVPTMIFNSEILKNANKNALFVELASNQSGIDAAATKSLSINYINANGLPGKTAPITAGEIMAKTIVSVFKENNIC